VGFCRRRKHEQGERVRVRFDGAWVLEREETNGDVIGFLHTHPDGPDSPSTRDVRTMRAWCSAFGKPLVCLIDGPGGLRGWRFDHDAANGRMLAIVQSFPRGLVIGVDADG
jgi:proteasome lid subunit RPN8/RPN11